MTDGQVTNAKHKHWFNVMFGMWLQNLTNDLSKASSHIHSSHSIQSTCCAHAMQKHGTARAVNLTQAFDWTFLWNFHRVLSGPLAHGTSLASEKHFSRKTRWETTSSDRFCPQKFNFHVLFSEDCLFCDNNDCFKSSSHNLLKILIFAMTTTISNYCPMMCTKIWTAHLFLNNCHVTVCMKMQIFISPIEKSSENWISEKFKWECQ